MVKLMRATLVDSEHQIFSGDVEHLVVTASGGELGVYPNHIPLICKLKPGVLRLQIPNEKYQQVYAVSGGYLEVQNNHATILADVVERTEKLDEERLVAEHDAAVARVKRCGSSSNIDIAKAQVALEVAIAQLKTLELKTFIERY